MLLIDYEDWTIVSGIRTHAYTEERCRNQIVGTYRKPICCPDCKCRIEPCLVPSSVGLRPESPDDLICCCTFMFYRNLVRWLNSGLNLTDRPKLKIPYLLSLHSHSTASYANVMDKECSNYSRRWLRNWIAWSHGLGHLSRNICCALTSDQHAFPRDRGNAQMPPLLTWRAICLPPGVHDRRT